MKKPVVVILLIVILLAALGGGWWWYQSSRQQPLTLYGNVDIRTVNMSFRVGGRLASLTVDEGDSIRAGQTLGELDRAPYENALLQAQANVSTAQAQYDLMMAGYRAEEIAQAAAAVKQAQAAYDYAQNFYQRQLGLRASSAISANDLRMPAPRAIRRRQRSNRRRISCVSIAPVTARRRLPRPKPVWNRRRRRWPRPNWTCTIPCSPPLLTVR
ncbi:membrane anchor protein YbhG [Klebsiella pneumoniae]|uniref:Membrane anchor protein YbhG n=1 Tax=Klebsiella pneumoniae TaxID=573 RepID=A0A4P0XZW8_KLEPN|nr:membrane anchor protein YbhG [Klebsiella pneumoniae]